MQMSDHPNSPNHPALHLVNVLIIVKFSPTFYAFLSVFPSFPGSTSFFSNFPDVPKTVFDCGFLISYSFPGLWELSSSFSFSFLQVYLDFLKLFPKCSYFSSSFPG